MNMTHIEQILLIKIRDFLEGCAVPCVDLVAVRIYIGAQEFIGMHYRQGVEDTATRYYIAGALPKGYKSGNINRDGTKFVADDASYYVAAYMPASRINELNAMHHPIGEHFLLFKNQHGWNNAINELPVRFEVI
jgi:hypothetical protein